ncbi:MAG: diguanylate cyclase, partial [Actinomycetales bacterium]|nr:diguanylate cyclase [Actinomycetales bacterium]
MRQADPGRISTVAAEYAAHGGIDDALVRAASDASVGLVQVLADGGVWWSDEAYRLHGRPRWRRVRALSDLAWGLSPRVADQVRAAYAVALTDPDVELRYTATPEPGPARELVLRALDLGVLVVHAAAGSEPADVIDLRDAASGLDASAPGTVAPPAEPVGAYAEPVEPLAPAGDGAVEEGTAEPPAPGDEQQLASAVLKATPDLVLLYDLRTRRVVTMAGNDDQIAGIVAHLRSGAGLRDDVHPEDYPALVAWTADLPELEPGEVRHIDVRFRIGGAWRWREIRASEFRRGPEGTDEVVVVARDVHERVEAGRRIAESERAFREVFDASPVGLAVLDAHGRFTDVNDAFCLLAGRTREAVLATVYEALLHPEDRAAAVISRARAQHEGTPQTAAERRLTRADGSMIWVRVRTSEIAYAGDVRTLVSIEDVTSVKATEDQLRHDALHDELTGLPNRRLLVDRLERAITRSRRSGTRLAVYFIDLDELKRVNDTHPWQHRAGDVLLTSVATAVRDTLREADTLGRLGGDEFVAVCEDVGDDSTIADLADRILRAVCRPLTIGEETVLVGASVGVAVTDDDTESAEHLLSRADAAMFAAKAAGGSRAVRSETVADDAGLDLVGALARRELRLHYQPVVSLLSGVVLGVTTVVKWRHPERGMLPATEVRTAISAGAASLPVVRWAIERAISDVRTVAPSRVEYVSVWLPVPGRAALAASTRTAVANAIAGPDGTLTADSAPSLVLDVHEQDIASLTKRRALHRHLDELLAEGPLALGVERFTADAVPVGMLQLLSAASVSIDPELLAAAGDNESTADLVRALVSAAGALGVITIAMDVESHEQLDVARGLGIQAAYGDLIGPPAPLDTYSDLLHGGRMTLPEPRSAAAPDAPPSPRTPARDVVAGPSDTEEALWSQLTAPSPADAPTPRLLPAETPGPAPRLLPPEESPSPVVRRPVLGDASDLGRPGAGADLDAGVGPDAGADQGRNAGAGASPGPGADAGAAVGTTGAATRQEPPASGGQPDASGGQPPARLLF